MLRASRRVRSPKQDGRALRNDGVATCERWLGKELGVAMCDSSSSPPHEAAVQAGGYFWEHVSATVWSGCRTAGGPRGKRKSHRSLAVGRQAGRHGQRDDDRHSSRVRGVACSGRPASQHDQMARERVGRREGTGTGPGAEKSCLRSRLACAIIIDPFTYACTGYP